MKFDQFLVCPINFGIGTLKYEILIFSNCLIHAQYKEYHLFTIFKTHVH